MCVIYLLYIFFYIQGLTSRFSRSSYIFVCTRLIFLHTFFLSWQPFFSWFYYMPSAFHIIILLYIHILYTSSHPTLGTCTRRLTHTYYLNTFNSFTCHFIPFSYFIIHLYFVHTHFLSHNHSTITHTHLHFLHTAPSTNTHTSLYTTHLYILISVYLFLDLCHSSIIILPFSYFSIFHYWVSLVLVLGDRHNIYNFIFMYTWFLASIAHK